MSAFNLIEPATGQTLASVPRATADDADRVVRRAAEAFPAWRAVNTRARGRMLMRLSQLIRDHAEELARLESRNVGKPIRDSRDEVALAANCFEYYAGTTNKIGGQTIPGAAPGVLMTAASNFCAPVTLFKAAMITYYVDNTTTPGTPRLTRQLNHGGCPLCPARFNPQALAGVVEDLDLTYDLYDGVTNPVAVTSLPYTLAGVTYTEGMIRKVNLHIGVRSETMSKPNNDYVRNHVSTSVNLRSLSAVDRYISQSGQ